MVAATARSVETAPSSTPTFYYGRVSGNSARTAFALYEAGCDFHLQLVDTRAGANHAAAYVALNPMGKIPSLTDGDVELWESNAINWYLAEKHPEARLLPPSLAGRASVQRWLFFQAAHVTPACVPLLRATSTRMQAFWHLPVDPRAADAARVELHRYLPVLDRALAEREWLEDAFSLADIAYAPHLWLLAEGGFDLAPWPRLRTWLERLLARPAWLQAFNLIFEAETREDRGGGGRDQSPTS